MAGFGVAEIGVGAGRAALCPLPLAAEERARILDWGPALMVSLTGPEELRNLGAASLPQALARAGVPVVGFAVPDYGIPDPALDWPALARRLHAALDSGGRVLAQCRGGCGRSGMILLRLMVERGEDPGTALARLRKVRPCAVETDEQLAWAAAGGTRAAI